MPKHRKRNIKEARRRTEGRHFSFPLRDTTPTPQKKPVFSLEYLQDSHCISLCDNRDKISFVNTLRKLSKLTWNEIRNTQRHGLGSEKIYRSRLQVAVPQIIPEDVIFIAIRFSGLKPMVGFQHDRIFNIVWFDKDLNVYDHGR